MRKLPAILVVTMLFVVVAGPTHAVVQCAVRDLGAGSIANGISDVGTVGCKTAAVAWFKGRTINFGRYLPAGDSRAFGINNKGQVVGYTMDMSGNTAAFLYIGGRPEQTLVLPELIMAYSIDDAMNIYGYRQNEFGRLRGAILQWAHGIIGELEPLPGFTESIANHGNTKLQAVGISQGEAGIHATIWNSEGVPADLHPEGATYSFANSINDAGQVAGSAEYWENGTLETKAFFWDANGIPTEIVPPAAGFCQANDINDLGQVCGTYRKTAEGVHQAFVWEKGVGGNNLVATGWALTDAYGINDLGQVCGVGFYKGVGRAFVATPRR
ncbi:MAG: DUF3466 family protein [Armatimonadota bacterium]|nr:DUF3466 family protein [Armatimonadota bacterium]